MDWLEVPRETSLRGRLAVISGFGLLFLILRFSGHEFLSLPLFGLAVGYWIMPLLGFAVFYWAGGVFAGWYMGRKFAKRGLVNVMAWACFVGLFSVLAGAFAVGASYKFNRFRKDVPRRFVLLPTAGLVLTILSALVAQYIKHGRL
jgi:hypothetical protein